MALQKDQPPAWRSNRSQWHRAHLLASSFQSLPRQPSLSAVLLDLVGAPLVQNVPQLSALYTVRKMIHETHSVEDQSLNFTGNIMPQVIPNHARNRERRNGIGRPVD